MSVSKEELKQLGFVKEDGRQEFVKRGVRISSEKEIKDKLGDDHPRQKNKITSNFSTDEEDEEQPIAISGKSGNGALQDDKEMSISVKNAVVSKMTDSSLYDFLVKAGKSPGPVIGSTRPMYEKIVVRLLREDSSLLKQIKGSATNGHGNVNEDQASHHDYSDTDDDDEAIETASKASRSSSITASKNFSVVGSPVVEAESPSRMTRSRYRQSPDTSFEPIRPAAKISGVETRTTSSRAESLGTYRRVTETSGDREPNLFFSKEKVAEPRGLVKKSHQKWPTIYLWIAVLLVTILAGVSAYLFLKTDAKEDSDKELDDILASLN